MSASVAVQDLVLMLLKASPDVHRLVGGNISDGAREARVYPAVEIGPSSFFPLRMDGVVARVESVQIDVWCRDGGKRWPCKNIVDAVVTALDLPDGADLKDPYALTLMEVSLARVMDDRDPLTTHGVVQLDCTVETR
ncbi:MAG: DUF3168 domain-containing protein [Rhodobacteraceae bacterium]|nr:DUF3168 domain-containing protein [Paracoccaceae bacterium]